MKKILCAMVWICVQCSIAVGAVDSEGLDSSGNPNVNLFCRDTPLEEVVESVYEQTGFTVHVEEDLLAMPITGNFNDVEIDSFFRRIFKGENISLLFSEKDKVYVIQTFGQKERTYYTAGNAGKIDPLTRMKINELEDLHEKQRKAFQEYSQNPLSVDALTGMKLGEIQESQNWQREVFLELSGNPDSMDPVVGKTLGKIKESHAQQRQAFQDYSESAEAVDPLTGQNLTAIKKSQESQRKAFQRFSDNKDSIDPLTGLTLGQIQESQERQRKEYLGK